VAAATAAFLLSRYPRKGNALMQSLDCRACAARVHVAKYSPAHTSIQWTDSARAACHEIAAARDLDPAAYVMRCAALDSTVDEAVSEGKLRATTRVEPSVRPLASEDTVTAAR
jgi:hypothetical protein